MRDRQTDRERGSFKIVLPQGVSKGGGERQTERETETGLYHQEGDRDGDIFRTVLPKETENDRERHTEKETDRIVLPNDSE